MPNIEVAASPIGADVQVVLHSFDVIGADHHHRLIRLVVPGPQEGVSRNELKTASEASFQFYCQAVVTGIGSALEQTDPGKARDGTNRRMTQTGKAVAARPSTSHAHVHAKSNAAPARTAHSCAEE